MGPIMKTKKKGRPSKADLARRAAAAEEKDARRSRRRRNVKYIFDELIGEEESERRRERKLKLLLKGGGESAPSRTRRVARSPAASVSSSEYGDEDNPSKRRKIGGDDEIGSEINDDHGNEIDDEDEEVRRRKAGSKVDESVPEKPSDPQQGIPLPDKKALELILDKLQKKDTYGVYAEPVDPEELPDYHDVIEHPMDFATVRKKLRNGSYSTLEQFESDVLLICTNAMQYNAPDTIYYKQAHAIEELAKKKFQRLRINAEHYPKEFDSEHKPSSNSLAKKQINTPISWSAKEPVGSDFYSGTTLATLANMDRRVLGKTSLVDTSSDKAEDLQGRVLVPRFGRKPFVHDGNRRTTYNSSGQPVVGSDSIFTTFEGEIRQLVAVGIHAEHSYSRSLARFAATLGRVGWSVASKRIEQALPPEFKFGRGWVGEYEPLSIPVLTLENCAPKELDLLYNSAARKDDKTSKTTFPNLEDKSSLFGSAVTKPNSSITASPMVPAKEQSVRGANLEEKQPFSCSGGIKSTTNASVNYPLQSTRYRKNVSGKEFEKQAELSCPPISANQNTCSFVADKPIPNGLKVPENHEFVARGLPNGKVLSNSLDRNTVFSSSESIPKKLISASYVPQGQHQRLSDPVHLVGILGEISQEQQETMNHPPVMPSVPSSRRDDPNNAASAAARAWVEIGAGGTKSAQENTIAHKNQISISSQFQGDFPVWVGNETQFRNRPVDFSESVMTDLSRFQMLTTWRDLNPQRQQSQKQESFPPDLNIGVQSSGSPVRQSSDLALHL